MKYIKKYENIDWDNDWDFEENPPIINEFKGNENFYDFLVRNNILDKFIFNFNQPEQKIWRSKEYADINLNDFLNNMNRSDFINLCFNWEGTKEKHRFWSSFNDQWLNELYVNESFDFDWDNDWDFEEEFENKISIENLKKFVITYETKEECELIYYKLIEIGENVFEVINFDDWKNWGVFIYDDDDWVQCKPTYKDFKKYPKITYKDIKNLKTKNNI